MDHERLKNLRWSNLRIGQKYLMNLGVILILTFAAVVLSAALLIFSLDKVDSAGAEGNRVVQITEIGSLFLSKDTRVVDYLLNPGDAAVNAYSKDQMKLTQAEKKIEPYMKTPEQVKIFSQIMRNDSMTYNNFQNEFVPAVLMQDMNKAKQLRSEQNKIQDNTLNLLQQLRASLVKQQQSAVANAQTQIKWAIGFLVSSLALSILIGGAVTLIIERRLRQSFDHVVNMTDRIAAGDLRESDKNVSGKDELGLIAGSIAKMKANLLTMTESIAHLSETTKNNSNRLIHSAYKVSQSSKDVKHTMSELSSGIEGQAENTSRISDMTRDFMKDLAAEVSRAVSIYDLSLSAVEVTKKGKTSIDESIKNMNSIDGSVQNCLAKMNHLEERMKNISKLIGLIEEIAGQTNLLALNASIESARAGKDGKGFSVIAESIRRLSNQTSASAKEISGMMNGIRTDSSEVNEALNMSYEKVERGSEQIDTTGRQFTRIDEQMQTIGKKMQIMSTRLRKVSEIGVNMRQSIEAIAAVSEESAASVGEVSLSMDGVNETMTSFRKDAETMGEAAQQLDKLIKRFKI
ncbi:methyl-accepting chemotaxis protein [Sporolactobacillus sp. KGMB 08714]|uniref:methyl-accepting chemotaxis protein n=1 Tax=Sporolactobacillus sp. KGMB 08714 TaxID=3064704 RepID=UPI002FBF026B